jgi:hypothetical protein
MCGVPSDVCEQSHDPWLSTVPCRCSRCSRWRRRRRAACSWTARRWAPAAARRAPARAPCSCTSVRHLATVAAMRSCWMDSGSRIGRGSDCSGSPGRVLKGTMNQALWRSGAAGLTNGVLLRTEVDHVTGQLSDTRTRFLGTRPPKVGPECSFIADSCCQAITTPPCTE